MEKKIKTTKELDQNSIELELLENTENNEKCKKENRNKLIYGNDINIKNPAKLGNLRAFIYINNYPLIAVGPNCNKIY